MSATDYIIDILLVALVLRQIVPRRLTEHSVLLPLILLVFAGQQYLHGFPTKGNDLVLEFILIAAGAVFGVLSGVFTKVWRNEQGDVYAQAGLFAAAMWVLGTGIRMAFDIWAHTSSGEASVIRFSIQHSITTTDAYTTGFVLMAFAQVLIRIGILQYRRTRLRPRAVTPVGAT